MAGGATDWATVAVLAQKSRPKDAAHGGMYSVWNLSDLAGAPP